MKFSSQQQAILELKKNAAHMKLAMDLIDIHQKFIKKLDETNDTINKKTGPKGEKGDQGPQGIPGKNGEPGKDGEHGKDGNSLNFDEVISNVLGKIKMPEDGKPGKDAVITKDHITKIAKIAAKHVNIPDVPLLDPMKVIEQIQNLPEGKRISTKHIDGLEQTLRAFKSQMDRGYLHGGGDTVIAGTGIVITKNANGNKIISAPNAGGTWTQDAILTRTNGTNYNLPSTPLSVLFLYLNGQKILQNIDYTRSGSAITMTSPTISSDVVSATFL